jgi:hypothetical protein
MVRFLLRENRPFYENITPPVGGKEAQSGNLARCNVTRRHPGPGALRIRWFWFQTFETGSTALRPPGWYGISGPNEILVDQDFLPCSAKTSSTFR